MQFLIHLLVVTYLGLAIGQKLPDYIQRCARSKPDFHKCCVENGKKAVPYILKGDKHFKIPVLAPLNLPKVAIQPNDNLKITLTNVEVHGIETVDIKDILIDFKKNTIMVSLDLDHLTVLGQYEIDGRLIVPLRGSGPCNITTSNSHIEYLLNFSIEKKSGKDYLKIEKDTLTLKSERVYYQLDNLFGNKELSDQTNRILNENALEVGRELNGPVSETIRSVVTELIKNYLTQFPLDEVFLD